MGARGVGATTKVALAISAEAGVVDKGEFCAVGIALINSTNSQSIGVGLHFNDATSDATPLMSLGFEDLFSGFGGSAGLTAHEPGRNIYLKLEKSTTAAYTSANTYNMYISGNGVIWHQIATGSKTFTTACDRVGLLFRRPKSQTGTPKGEAVVDFFRKVA